MRQNRGEYPRRTLPNHSPSFPECPSSVSYFLFQTQRACCNSPLDFESDIRSCCLLPYLTKRKRLPVAFRSSSHPLAWHLESFINWLLPTFPVVAHNRPPVSWVIRSEALPNLDDSLRLSMFICIPTLHPSWRKHCPLLQPKGQLGQGVGSRPGDRSLFLSGHLQQSLPAPLTLFLSWHQSLPSSLFRQDAITLKLNSLKLLVSKTWKKNMSFCDLSLVSIIYRNSTLLHIYTYINPSNVHDLN